MKKDLISIPLLSPLAVIIFLAFFFAKIYNLIDWEWVWVFSPLWIPIVLVIMIYIVLIVLYGIILILSKIWK